MMAGEKRDAEQRGARLDRLGREVVRASSACDEHEAESAARSPFLYARIRAGVEAERRRREESEGWLALFAVAWRAVPAMVLVTVLALALFLSAGAGEVAASGAGLGDDALLGARDGDIEQVVFVGARAPSSDDVLTTIIGGDEKEGAR
jgi:hypothetical protein